MVRCKRIIGSGWDAEVCMGWLRWPPVDKLPYWKAFPISRSPGVCTKCKGGSHD